MLCPGILVLARARKSAPAEPVGHIAGVGGVFFKAKDPKAFAAWYRDVLGRLLDPWGGAALWEPKRTASPYRQARGAMPGSVQVLGDGSNEDRQGGGEAAMRQRLHARTLGFVRRSARRIRTTV